MEAASEATMWIKKVRALNGSIMGKGYPAFSGILKAPFDVIGDSLRGTTGVMMTCTGTLKSLWKPVRG